MIIEMIVGAMCLWFVINVLCFIGSLFETSDASWLTHLLIGVFVLIIAAVVFMIGVVLGRVCVDIGSLVIGWAV